MRILEYTKEGRIYRPTLQMEEPKHFGKFGQLRMRYIQENREDVHILLLMKGKLNHHLKETDQKATEMMQNLVEQMKKEVSLPDPSDTVNYMKMMRNLQKSAEEIVLKELIYV